VRSGVLIGTVLAVLFVPGIVLGWCLRLRGLLLAATAPVLTFTVCAVTGMWLRPLGVRWEPLTALAALTVASLAAVAVSRRLARDRDDRITAPAGPPWSLAGPVLGSALALVMVGHGIGWNLDYVNQSWDPPWHANLTALIASSGNGDWTASVGNDIDAKGMFYPAALNVVEALVVDLTGQDAARVFNAFLVLSAVLLPWATFLLVRVAAPRWPVAAAAAALVAIVPPDNPWGQVGTQAWAWSMAVTPVAVALVVLTAAERRRLAVPASVLALAAPVALQPAGFASAAVLLACWVLVAPAGLRGRAVSGLWVGGMAALSLVLVAPELRAGKGSVESVATWFTGPAAPLRTSLSVALVPHGPALGGPVLLAVTIFGVVGLGAAVAVRELRWPASVYVVAAALLLASMSAPPSIRPYITGLWYSDVARLARLHAFAAVVVAGLGAGALTAVGQRQLRSDVLRRVAVAVPALALLAGAVLQDGPVRTGVDMVQLEYAEHPGGPSITPQQVAVLRTVAPLFGPDEFVVVDTWQGGVWLYALTGVHSIQGRYGDAYTHDADVLLRRLNDIATDPEVARLVVEHKVCGVYVGRGSVVPKDWTWSGFAGLAEGRNPAFRQVYADRDSQVYLLTGALARAARCRSAEAPATPIPSRIAVP